jgi:DNA repair exonuclease SbcCD ATPase subunit
VLLSLGNNAQADSGILLDEKVQLGTRLVESMVVLGQARLQLLEDSSNSQAAKDLERLENEAKERYMRLKTYETNIDSQIAEVVSDNAYRLSQFVKLKKEIQELRSKISKENIKLRVSVTGVVASYVYIMRNISQVYMGVGSNVVMYADRRLQLIAGSASFIGAIAWSVENQYDRQRLVDELERQEAALDAIEKEYRAALLLLVKS